MNRCVICSSEIDDGDSYVICSSEECYSEYGRQNAEELKELECAEREEDFVERKEKAKLTCLRFRILRYKSNRALLKSGARKAKR